MQCREGVKSQNEALLTTVRQPKASAIEITSSCLKRIQYDSSKYFELRSSTAVHHSYSYCWCTRNLRIQLLATADSTVLFFY